MRTAAELIDELRALDESHIIEAKRGSAIDKSVLETVCAFSNEPGLGEGYILLGVATSTQGELFGHGYEVVGVEDPDKLQSDLATQCRSAFNRPVRPRIKVEEVGDKRVVVLCVREASAADKPIYLDRLGLPRGAFRRVGSTDQEGTDDDLQVLYGERSADSYDSGMIRDADTSDLDPRELELYRQLRAQANPNAEELRWSDEELLRSLRAVKKDGQGVWRPTVAGLLLFGTRPALRRCFPMMRVDYIRIPGRRWVENPDHRFDTVEIRAPLMTAVRRAVAAIVDDLPVSFDLPEGQLTRSDETLLPTRVLREAIVNAVMHRSYKIQGAIQILRYANRLEIRNPGHSLKAEEHLGEPGSETRNPVIAAVLHDTRMAETKDSGIRAMRELMLNKGLLPPTFESSWRPDHFVATLLFHHFLGPEDISWLGTLGAQLSGEEARALVFVRELGAINNAAYRDINRVETLNASGHLRRLRDLGLLEMKGSGSGTYYLPGPGLLAATPSMVAASADVSQVAPDPPTPPGPELHVEDPDLQMASSEVPQLPAKVPHPSAEVPQLPAEVPHPSAEVPQLPAEVPHPSAEVPQLPPDLARRVAAAGPRPRLSAARELIVDLCRWRPLSAAELAALLGGGTRRICGAST